MNKNYPIQERYEDEIDLVDLIKILIRNYKLIVFITVLITGLGISYGFYIKNKEVPVLEQQFQIDINKNKINILDLFYMEDVRAYFFEYELIQELYSEQYNFIRIDKIDFLKSLYILFDKEKKTNKNNKNNFIIDISKISEENIQEFLYGLDKDHDFVVNISKFYEENTQELLNIFYSGLNYYINSIIKNEYSKKYQEVIKNYDLYKDLSESSQKEIKKLIDEDLKLDSSVNSTYRLEALRALNSKTFAEKDVYTNLYKKFLNDKLNLERETPKSMDYIRVKSSIYELESKVKLKLIVLISFVLGGFLGMFAVFVKEFIKNIDWKN